MKITGLFEKILEEQIANKKLFSFLFNKWKEEKPDLTEEQTQSFYERFQQIKGNLNPKIPQVVSFLSRYDGNFGYEAFDQNNLKDITKYSYKQIKSLIEEYTPLDELEEVEDKTIFNDDNTEPTPEKIQASKDLWFGDRYCILNLPGFRVYDIPDQSTSVKFGYYSETILKQLHGSFIWCVARRKDHNLGNLWSLYRNDNQRSFYFVIDESKSPEVVTNPEISKFYVSALQYDNSSHVKYRITSVLNDGDTLYHWEDVVKLYPQLKDKKEIINPKPYTDEELKQKNVFYSISEAPGPNEFRRIGKNLKKLFIVNGGVLRKPESWISMDKELKSLYVNSITKENYITKISTYEFLNEIKKIGNDLSLLNNRLKALGLNGAIDIFKYFIKNDYRHARVSKENPNIILFSSKTDGKFGLFDGRNGDWVNKNGVVFEPLFSRVKQTMIKDDKNVPYIVEIYSKTTSPDDQSFYALTPYSSGTSTKSYFLTSDAYKKLTEKITNIESKGKTITAIKDFEPEKDVDISETKEKGVE